MYNKHPNQVVVENAVEAGENYYNHHHRNKRSVTQQQINDVAKKVSIGCKQLCKQNLTNT